MPGPCEHLASRPVVQSSLLPERLQAKIKPRRPEIHTPSNVFPPSRRIDKKGLFHSASLIPHRKTRAVGHARVRSWMTTNQSPTLYKLRAVLLPRIKPTNSFVYISHKIEQHQKKQRYRLHQQHGVNAPVQFRRVGNLCVLSPDNLAALSHQAKITDVDLDHSALGHHSQLRKK